MATLAELHAPSLKSSVLAPNRELGCQRIHTITAEAGHALEKLGHAIEYLADELVHEHGTELSDQGRVDAIQMLMALNRSIYLACPIKHTMGERLRSLGSRFLSLN